MIDGFGRRFFNSDEETENSNNVQMRKNIETETIPLQYLLNRPDPEDIPNNWKYLDYSPAGIEVGCYRAHAHDGNPRSKITLISGFKADMETYDTPQVRALQRSGVELDIILLPDPGPQTGYLHDNREIIRELLTSNPPAGGLKLGIPNFIFGHSLGGRAFVANMLDEDFAQEINDNYAGAVLLAPHFSSPYRSTPVLNALYNSYCKVFSEKSYGEAPLDWALSATEKFRKMIKTYGNKDSLIEGHQEKSKITSSPITAQNTATTHGQILYSNIEGEKLWRRIQKHGAPDAAREFPMVMLGGAKDFVSSKNHIIDVAKEFDAAFYEFDTYHNPFLESKEAQKLIIKAMQQMTNNWSKMTVPTMDTIIELRHNQHENHDTVQKPDEPNIG